VAEINVCREASLTAAAAAAAVDATTTS